MAPYNEWLALLVNEVDETNILHGAGGKDRLPVQMVKFPVQDTSSLAVLSWRWDGDLELKGSWNIACAVHQATKMGVQYLFLDVISIDQDLPEDDLILQVLAFSKLYETIPVIAAYDMVDADFARTIRRPWILHETRLYRYNPTKIVYVGHKNQGTKDYPTKSMTRSNYVLGWESGSLEFGSQLNCIWSGSFVETIIGVLSGRIGMSCISDFRLIVPPYAQVLDAAYRKMGRNDYLLTAALLCGVPADYSSWHFEAIDLLTYGRYSFQEVENKGPHRPFLSSNKGIYLDGTQIGLWRFFPENSYEPHELEVLPEAERVMFEALGLEESDYQEFMARKDTRRACLVMKRKENAPAPDIEIYAVTWAEQWRSREIAGPGVNEQRLLAM